MKNLSFIILATLLLFSCNGDKSSNLFADRPRKEILALSLEEQGLQEIPSGLGGLTELKRLLITYGPYDSTALNLVEGEGWVVGPPLSPFRQSEPFDPPFRPFPKEILKLSNLEYLELEGLDIKELPKDLSSLTQLRMILLRYNKIHLDKSFLESINTLPNLEFIMVQGNYPDTAAINNWRAQNPELEFYC